MFCPECKNKKTTVLDSRNEGRLIRRRRECAKCRFRFTTHERTDQPKISVIKRGGETETYQRNKIAKGLYLALEKRPVNNLAIENAIDDIENEISKLKSKFISTKQVGDIVLKKLKELDEVAYLRFLSVYKSFGSAKKFQREAEKLNK